MTWHAVLLCEGAHDQAAILSLASQLAGWTFEKAVPESLPLELRKTYPEPPKNKSGASVFERPPRYLRAGDRWIEVRQLGGIDRVLGKIAADLLGRAKPNAVGIIVDANDAGVPQRVEAFKNRFRDLYPHADSVGPGTNCAGPPRLGLWVAPDNKGGGTMSDLLLEAASRVKPELTGTGREFVTSLGRLEPGDWSKDRSKAILGAVSQTVRPGGSLAVALEASHWLFASELHTDRPFGALMEFLRELTRP